jgi:hypothetical protein
MTHTLRMTAVDCFKCGIPFFVPERWDEQRSEDGREFFCPNGCRQAYVVPDPRLHDASRPQDEDVEQRRALVLRIHEQEQQEARDAERGASSSRPMLTAPATAIEQAVVKLQLANFNRDPKDRLKCPECGKRYRYLPCFRKHLHGHDSALWEALKTEAGLRAVGIITEQNQPPISSTGKARGDEAADVTEV